MCRFKAVKINETQHWNEKFRKDYGIKALFGVYVFDSESHTHCCELTPSYEMHFVHTQPDWHGELTEEQREDMYEQITEGDNYANEPVTYMHCSSVDRFDTIDLPGFEEIDEAVEYCQGNWV